MVLSTASIKRGASRWVRGGSCKANKAGVWGRGGYTRHKHRDIGEGGQHGRCSSREPRQKWHDKILERGAEKPCLRPNWRDVGRAVGKEF